MPTSHQTVRLSRGAHPSLEEGACAVELAAVLAGEPFGDRPAAVSPVVAAFLRGYNDAIDPDRRQDLLEVAALAAVGAGLPEAERRELAGAWCRALWGTSRIRWWLRPRYPDPDQVVEAAGRDTARRVRGGDAVLHDRALAFLRALTGAGDNSPTRGPVRRSYECLSDHKEGVLT